MRSNNFRVALVGMACAAAMVTLLAACGGSSVASSMAGAGGSGGNGSSAPATITGIATPKSVSVVTAN